MSQENVEIYRRAVDAYNQRDLEAFLGLCDPQIQFVSRISGVDGAVSGHAGVRSWWENVTSAFKEAQIEIASVRQRGDWVVAVGTHRIRGAASDLALDVPLAHAMQMREGKILRFESFHTLDQALEAAGLSE